MAQHAYKLNVWVKKKSKKGVVFYIKRSKKFLSSKIVYTVAKKKKGFLGETYAAEATRTTRKGVDNYLKKN